jgi:hypothetical protein
MTNKIKSIVSSVIISLFVFLFAYTGLSKIFHRNLFLIILRQSPLLNSYAGIVSWVLPVAELCTALLLIIKNTQRLALYITLALMLIFTFYILYLLLFVPALPCSCGGVLQSLSWSGHLILNLFLVFLSLFEILLTNLPVYKYSLKTN